LRVEGQKKGVNFCERGGESTTKGRRKKRKGPRHSNVPRQPNRKRRQKTSPGKRDRKLLRHPSEKPGKIWGCGATKTQRGGAVWELISKTGIRTPGRP